MKFEIKGISGVMTGINNAVPVLIDSAGQLGTINSSRRYKEDIDNMARASDNLLSLRPVIFRYKKAIEDGDIPIQYGLIAEEVAKVFPALVVYNEHGEPETVKYHLLATLLLNELQKLRSEIQTLQQVIVDQATQVIVDQAAHLVSLVEQNRAHESEQERLVALEAKVAKLTALTALLTQSVTPVSEVQLASNYFL